MAKPGVSEADLDSIRRIYAALNRGEIDAASELLDPDVEWEIAQAAPEYRTCFSMCDVTCRISSFLPAMVAMTAFL